MSSNQHERLPAEISDTLRVQWPKQFTLTTEATETEKRVFQRSLLSFARSVHRIMASGVSVEQITLCLDQIVNEPGYRKMDRGGILKRLWTLVPARPAEVLLRKDEPVRDPVLSGANPALRALRENRSIEAAVRAHPWFGQRIDDGSGRRHIDRPLWRDLHEKFHAAGYANHNG